MTTIMEGTQYALTSSSNEKNHSVVFVKLTDSALKAIEDYALAFSKGNVSNSVKPLIELRPNNSQGIITIPNNKENTKKLNSNDAAAQEDKQCYNFSVKDIQNGGILECVKQTNSNMSMESLGKIMLRMQIHANDDVYQKTKVKMHVVAEQELKKYNTKVINSSDVSGRKMKMKRTPFSSKFSNSGNTSTNNINSTNSNSSSIASLTNNSTTSSTSTAFFNNNNKQQTANSALSRFSKYNNNTNNGNSTNNQGNNLITSTGNSNTQQTQKSGFSNNSFNTNTTTNSLSSSQQQQSNSENNNNNIQNKIREAVLKQEANKINTLSPLQSSSGSNTNKFNSVTSGNINITNSNGNNSISPFSDHSAKSHSSPNSLTASPNNPKSLSPSFRNHNSNNITNNNQKRNPEFPLVNNNQKKFKSDPTSKYNARQVPTKSSNNSHYGMANYSPYSNQRMSQPPEHDHHATDSRTHNKSNHLMINNSFSGLMKKSYHNNERDSSSGSQSYHNSNHHLHPTRPPYGAGTGAGNGSGSINSSPNSSPDSDISNTGNVLSSDSSFNNDSEDYISKYPKIQDLIQLNRYKEDFDAEFPEYKKLYDYLEGVTRQFEELKLMIQAKEEESEEWQDLIKQIFEKYDEVKNRSRYQKAQKRLTYLHHKLLHIKNMIHEYLANANKDKCISTNQQLTATAKKPINSQAMKL